MWRAQPAPPRGRVTRFTRGIALSPHLLEVLLLSLTLTLSLTLSLTLTLSLLEVYGRSAGVHALVLSPCCLKGWLGKAARRQAEQQGGGAERTRRAAALAGGFQAAGYRALVEGLRERLCAAGGGAVEVDEAAYDEQVLSPVNGFITARRRALPHAQAQGCAGQGCAGQAGQECAAVFELGGMHALGWQASGVF